MERERGRGSSRGGQRGGRGGGSTHQPQRKENILDLSKYQDKQIRVRFTGGREAVGILKGYDQLMNLVLDNVEEHLRDPEDGTLLDKTRSLGLVVCRGPTIVLISPTDGVEEIENPFAVQES